jgi:adenylate cyclase
MAVRASDAVNSPLYAMAAHALESPPDPRLARETPAAAPAAQAKGSMEVSRQTVVLFADVTGSTRLYESAGDAIAMDAIERCLALMRHATESAGGRVVKTIGDEIMALFSTPDAATAAAAEMQHAVDQLMPVANTKLALRIGFHCGPVMQREGDVFGDTVNVASRLVEQAVRGQIITSSETLAMLGPVFRAWTRRLYSIQVKGRTGEVELCEVIWSQRADTTAISVHRSAVKAAPVALRLRYRGVERLMRRNPDSLIIGREQTPHGMVVEEPNASRLHCTIERRQDRFVLVDHSSNGTFVTVEGDVEVMLRREELTLRKRGWIAFGQPRESAAEVLEFFCD